jgi:hypothetical protein
MSAATPMAGQTMRLPSFRRAPLEGSGPVPEDRPPAESVEDATGSATDGIDSCTDRGDAGSTCFSFALRRRDNAVLSVEPHPRFPLPNNDAITKVRVSAISKTNQVRARLTIL